MGTFYLYLGAVGAYWWAFMTAGPFIIDECVKWIFPRAKRWLEEKLPSTTRRHLEITLITVGVFLAGFLAFKDEHAARLEAEKNRNGFLPLSSLQRHLDPMQKEKLRVALLPIAKSISKIMVCAGSGEEVRFALDFVEVFKKVGIEPLGPVAGFFSGSENDKGVMVGLTDINHPSDLAIRFIDALGQADLRPSRTVWSVGTYPGVDFDLFIGPQ